MGFTSVARSIPLVAVMPDYKVYVDHNKSDANNVRRATRTRHATVDQTNAMIKDMMGTKADTAFLYEETDGVYQSVKKKKTAKGKDGDNFVEVKKPKCMLMAVLVVQDPWQKQHLFFGPGPIDPKGPNGSWARALRKVIKKTLVL